jgi:hypothetical protein
MLLNSDLVHRVKPSSRDEADALPEDSQAFASQQEAPASARSSGDQMHKPECAGVPIADVY